MPVKKNSMIKPITLLLALFFGFSVMAQKAKRELLFMEDSAIIKTIKDYEEFSFTDTGGRVISGKVFLKNDSQFYFLNYFNEQKGPIHHLNEIKGTYVNLTMLSGGNERRGSGQKYFLSPGAVAAIYILSGGFAAPILIIREIILYYRFGPGHSLDRPTNRREKASSSIVYKTKLQYKIQRINSGS